MDDEVRLADDKVIQEAHQAYITMMGGPPQPEETPTREQLTSLRHVLSQRLPPYADLSVFAPFGARMARKLKFVGLVMAADGSLARKELPGPPNFQEWDQNYRVLRTALLQLQE
eukprot:6463975-Amphidinium_carterae.1